MSTETTHEDQNTNAEAQTTQNASHQEEGSKTFTQADIDAIVGKTKAEMKAKSETSLAEAIKAEREKWEAEAKMTEDERAQKRDAEAKADLERREQELNRRESLARAKELLADNNINPKFADYIIGADLETTEKTAEEFIKIFDKAVQETTNERLKGQTPPHFVDAKETQKRTSSIRTITKNGRTGF